MAIKEIKTYELGLNDLELVKVDDGYCLNAVYILEDETGIEEVRLEGVGLPISINSFDRQQVISPSFRREGLVDIGYGYYGCDKMTRRVLKEKHKEMTLAEIEKKLGYKIKIVAEE